MSGESFSVITFVWLLLIAFVVMLAARRAGILYAPALVITGLLIGIPRLLPQAHLEPRLLFTVFLPPLLFEASLNLRSEALRNDWLPICVYTFAGTLLGALVVGALLAWWLHLPFAVALTFGALISATDPISVTALFRRLGTTRRLTLLLEAESLFNDGVGAVLFTVCAAGVTRGAFSFAGGVWQFVWLTVGGALLGTAIGAAASRIHYALDDHLVELTLTTVVAFGSYLCAEAAGVSGVVAVVSAGLVLGNRGMRTAMSPQTALAVTAFWEYAGFCANSIVFLLIGIEVVYIDWTQKSLVVVFATLAVLTGRACIYPLSWLLNRMGAEIPIAWRHVLFWGGLRGALSMALALGLPAGFPQRTLILGATFGVTLFSLLVQGLTMMPLLRRVLPASGGERALPETGALRGEIFACEAALMELDHLFQEEIYPDWSVEALRQEYRNRLASLEALLLQEEPDYAQQRAVGAQRALRLALTAEKHALQEAERHGWIREEASKELRARIDAELVRLAQQHHDHEPQPPHETVG